MAEVRTAVRSFAAGAAAMYFFDPRMGRRRRALFRDGALCRFNSLAHQMDKAWRDVGNRAQGAVTAIRGAMRRDHAGDAILAQRVRSAIGRVVSHPHALEVSAGDACIVLRGHVLSNELHGLMSCVRGTRGVREVVNHLEVHEDASGIASLQGGVHRESRAELMQRNWTPGLRVGAGALGGGILIYASRNRGALRVAGSVAGAALLARAILNKEFRQIIGAGSGARIIEFNKAIHVCAPAEEVFAFWANYQNFPRFMTHIKEVRDLGGGRSHWVAEGPAGIPVSWDAEVTRQVKSKLLAWRSVPGSRVETEGVVRFDEEPEGTRVGIRLFYSPPAGVVGHMLARLFGANPKQEMDDDMVRFKSLIETGKTRAHGRPVTLEEVSCAPQPQTGRPA